MHLKRMCILLLFSGMKVLYMSLGFNISFKSIVSLSIWMVYPLLKVNIQAPYFLLSSSVST